LREKGSNEGLRAWEKLLTKKFTAPYTKEKGSCGKKKGEKTKTERGELKRLLQEAPFLGRKKRARQRKERLGKNWERRGE